MVKIYSLTHPSSNRFYIGKTECRLKDRLQRHIYQSLKNDKPTRKNSWIISLHNKGLKPEINLVAEVNDDEWVEKERYYIALARQVAGDDLLNSPNFPGGEGFDKGNQWGKISKKDHVKKMYHKICPECKKHFSKVPKLKDSKFCSYTCSNAYVSKNRKKRTHYRGKLICR